MELLNLTALQSELDDSSHTNEHQNNAAALLREVGQRVARFLVAEARRHGQPTSDGVCLTLTQTNQQIAARVGSVREVISRAFSRLQHDGLIVLQDRKLTIPDIEALSSFAQH